jgi:hypothetical protein
MSMPQFRGRLKGGDEMEESFGSAAQAPKRSDSERLAEVQRILDTRRQAPPNMDPVPMEDLFAVKPGLWESYFGSQQ